VKGVREAMKAEPSDDILHIPAATGWLERLPAVCKERVELEREGALVPVLVAGSRGGKRLVVTAAVHGDEFEGVRALQELFEEMDPAEMHGMLIAAPVTNVPAFEAAQRRSPLDEMDLARTFPGSAKGSPSERLACLVGEHLISLADFYVDLHSGGLRYRMPTMVGLDANDDRALAAARIFGAEVVWLHDAIPDGRTVSYARSKGIPWLYTEARGAGRIAAGDLAMMKRGVRRMLAWLGILADEGMAAAEEPSLWLRGDGNTDRGIEAGADGLLYTKVALLDRVRKGELLAELRDVYGRVTERYVAPADGVVALVHEFARVRKGESLFLLADEV